VRSCCIVANLVTLPVHGSRISWGTRDGSDSGRWDYYEWQDSYCWNGERKGIGQYCHYRDIAILGNVRLDPINYQAVSIDLHYGPVFYRDPMLRTKDIGHPYTMFRRLPEGHCLMLLERLVSNRYWSLVRGEAQEQFRERICRRRRWHRRINGGEI